MKNHSNVLSLKTAEFYSIQSNRTQQIENVYVNTQIKNHRSTF